MSVSLLEALESAGYDLETAKDARWFINQADELKEHCEYVIETQELREDLAQYREELAGYQEEMEETPEAKEYLINLINSTEAMIKIMEETSWEN